MRLDRITIAVNNMQHMVVFYNVIFNAKLQPVSAFGTTLYKGTLAGIELLMCPNEIAGVDAKQNRKQLRFVVDDVQAIAAIIPAARGQVINQDGSTIGVCDPDGNTIEFTQASTAS
jgi:predicted enzyme related to lactoylglutathione lyase